MQILSLTLLAAVLTMQAEAFAPAALMTASRTSHAAGALQMAASDKPLTELCEITKEACDAVSPMLNGERMQCDVIAREEEDTALRN